MNIREFRAMTDGALRDEGFEPYCLMPRRLWAWTIRGEDIVRAFVPNAYRRPWGFAYRGGVGIEIPALRAWLDRYRPGQQVGRFHTWFAGYEIANEDVLGDFTVLHDDPVPADLWAGLLKDRLLRIPASLDSLVALYRRDREKLGWLAHPHDRPAWDFLLKWHEDPDPALPVPPFPYGQLPPSV